MGPWCHPHPPRGDGVTGSGTEGLTPRRPQMLTNNRIWRNRTVDIGVITAEEALNYGFRWGCPGGVTQGDTWPRSGEGLELAWGPLPVGSGAHPPAPPAG